MPITLPVRYLLNDGTPTSDTVNGKPCIEVGFTLETSSTGSFSIMLIKKALAEIDTGSPIAVIDESFVNLLGVNADSESEVTTVNGVSTVKIYSGTFLFYGPSGAVASVPAQFITRPFSVHTSKILLGRSLLSTMSFAYNRTMGIQTIDVG